MERRPGKWRFAKLNIATYRYPPTDEMFFVQNAGDLDAGTGLAKSSVVQKISLAEAEALRTGAHSESEVEVTVVPSNPQVINPNGEMPR